MKLWRLLRPEGTGGLALEPMDHLPLSPHDVRIGVRATALNYRDHMVVNGVIPYARRPGIVPVSDGAGEVVEVGGAVTRFVPGDRVAAAFYQDWLTGPRPSSLIGDLGGHIDGMLAQEVVLNEQGLVSLPDHLSWEEGATLPCAGVTAWAALNRYGPPCPGETVLTLGSGGVALFALQFACLAGARVIAVTRSAEKAKILNDMGAEAVIAPPDQDWSVIVAQRCGSVDLVIDTLGDYERSLAVLRDGGRLSVVGQRGGAGAGSFQSLLAREITAFGVGVGSRADFEAMNRAIVVHRLRPRISARFPFAGARDAFAALQEGAQAGKIIISHDAT